MYKFTIQFNFIINSVLYIHQIHRKIVSILILNTNELFVFQIRLDPLYLRQYFRTV